MPHPVPPPAPPPLVQVLPSDTASDPSGVTDPTALSALKLQASAAQMTPVLEPVIIPGVAVPETQDVRVSRADGVRAYPALALPERAVLEFSKGGRSEAVALSEASSTPSSEPNSDPSTPTADASSPAVAPSESQAPLMPEVQGSEAQGSEVQGFRRPETPVRDRSPANLPPAPVPEAVRRNRSTVLGTEPIGIDPAIAPAAQYGIQSLTVDLSQGSAPVTESIADQRYVLDREESPFSMLEELAQLSGATIIAQSRGTPENPEGERQILTIPSNDELQLPPNTDPRSIPLQEDAPSGETSSEDPPSGDPPSENTPSEDTPPGETPSDPSTDLPIDSETPDQPGETLPPEDVTPPSLQDPFGDPLNDGLPLFPPIPAPETGTPAPPTASPPTASPGDPDTLTFPFTADVLELDADYQEFDTERDIFVAEGNVELRFRQAVLTADRIRVNMRNRQTVAEGNVIFTRGDQILLGERLDYNLVQGLGTVSRVRGEIFLPTSGQDLTVLSNDVAAQSNPSRPLGQTVGQDPPDTPRANEGLGINIGTLPAPGQNQLLGGSIRRFRFEADSADFYPNGWQATNVRITNDPFSPPEVELRSYSVTYTRISPFRAEIIARNPQIVFDQNFRLPLFQERIIIDSRRRSSDPIARIGFDDDLGGLYLERAFNVVNTPRATFSIAPLILVQRAIEDNSFNFLEPSSFGLITRFNYDFSPRTSLSWRAILESLELQDFEDNFRTTARLRQSLGRGPSTHQLTLEYVYRNRFFNGSLGFQEVQSSIGFVLTSPSFLLGDSNIFLSYQAGLQYITAETDRPELLPRRVRRDNVGLLRGQASVSLSRGFVLWRGTPLPPTRDQGLRFNAVPLVPSLILATSVRGVYSGYSSDDSQVGLTASVGLRGQVGHHVRDTFDYTAFNITFSTSIQEGSSPFRFDRAVDRNTLNVGILQQIYGPILFGVQTRINLDTRREIDTVYTLEYRRRTYSVILRYSPVRQEGSFNLQINDFDWGNLRDPFSGPTGAATVEGGVTLSDE